MESGEGKLLYVVKSLQLESEIFWYNVCGCVMKMMEININF